MLNNSAIAPSFAIGVLVYLGFCIASNIGVNASAQSANTIPRGVVTTLIGKNSRAFTILLQPDGKILAGGFTETSKDQNDFALARYMPDGRIDNSFGQRGVVITDFGQNEIVSELALLPDGKILAVGDSYDENFENSVAIARYNPDGSLDLTFGKQGRVGDLFGGVGQGISGDGTFLLPDGSFLVSGTTHQGFEEAIAVLKFTANGKLDQEFLSGEKVVLVGSNSIDMLPQPDGKFVLVGSSTAGSCKRCLTAIRLQADGQTDLTWAKGQALFSRIGVDSVYLRAATLQADGQVLVAGEASTNRKLNFTVARITAQGQIDATFGQNGHQTISMGKDSIAVGVTTQSNGKIVIAGLIEEDGIIPQSVIVQLNKNGSLDPGFGKGGQVFLTAQKIRTKAITRQPNGKIVVAGDFQGGSKTGYSLALTRLNTDGTLDTTFGQKP
jgi:uncharacterized delta-60 repeat protein